MTRLSRAWRTMSPEQRLAAIASVALLVTMLLPWYGLQSLNRRTGAINSHDISAFGDVSFVEAAVFLVALGVVAIVFARAEGREFHLPGGDGTIVTIAGGWAGLLIFYRVFARPAGHGYPVGIEWGFFLAFVAAGAVAFAGLRMRAAERPEPPMTRARRTRRGSPPDRDPPDDLGERADRGSTREPPSPLAEPGSRFEDEVTVVAPAAARPSRARPAPGRTRPRYPPAPPSAPEQLSFEDPQPGSE